MTDLAALWKSVAHSAGRELTKRGLEALATFALHPGVSARLGLFVAAVLASLVRCIFTQVGTLLRLSIVSFPTQGHWAARNEQHGGEHQRDTENETFHALELCQRKRLVNHSWDRAAR